MSEVLRRDFMDMQYTVLAYPMGHYVQFHIYQIDGISDDKPLWHRKGATCSPDFVESLDDAEIYCHGDVKWDGCSNWHFDEQDRVMLHGCTKEDILNFGKILSVCWEWASEIIDGWDGE